MKNSYDCSFVETKTNAGEMADTAEWVVCNVKSSLYTIIKAAEEDGGMSLFFKGALILADEALDSVLSELRGLKKEIDKLDPPRQLTDQEVEERLARRAAS